MLVLQMAECQFEKWHIARNNTYKVSTRLIIMSGFFVLLKRLKESRKGLKE
jgi:hypothetical protein